jgi:hypothetical protein
MDLKALLLCRNHHSVRILTEVLDEMDMRQSRCDSAQEAIELLARGDFAGLILDFDLPGAEQVTKLARLAPAAKRPVIFAIIGASTDIGRTIQAGVNFVLYKPLAVDQVARSLRAARGFMRKDRRHSSRQAVSTVVYLLFGKRAAIPALMLDLNEEGLSLQAAEPLPAVPELPVHFLLPGTTTPIEAAAEVIWADDTGRAGMFFTRMNSSAERVLKNWLRRRGKADQHRAATGSKGKKAAAASLRS